MKTAFLAGALLALATAGTAHAASAINLLTPGSAYTAAPYTLGFAFDAGSTVKLTKLGIYDSNGDGLEADAQVGLWQGTTLLASVSIGSGTAGELIGGFRYADITPFTLVAGQQYVVGSYMDSGVGGSAVSLATGQGGTGSFDPLLTNLSDRYTNFDYAFGVPTLSGSSSGAWLGANFVYGAVPEPQTWALFIGGFGLVGGALRRRRLVAA